MLNYRRIIATSTNPFAIFLRRVRRGIIHFSLPIPSVLLKPIVWMYLLVNGCYRFLKRVFVAEPFFKAHCRKYGRNVHTGIYLHWIAGKGDIILGDDVTFDGKLSITFASRFSDCPTLEIGDGTDLSHGCSLTIGKRITIGKHCMIAAGSWLFDSSGHSTDPASRLANLPPAPEEVKPITIGDNVWIGRHSMIFPGVTVGEGSVISAGSVVMVDVPPYTVVAGNPARRIASLTPPPALRDVPDSAIVPLS